MRVIEAMTHHCERLKASDSIRSAAQRMGEQDIGMILVEDSQGEMRGVVTDRDITCRAVAEGMSLDAPLEQCMSEELVTCHTQDSLYDAIELMKRERVRRLLVLDLDEKPAGVLAQADVAAAIASYGPAGEMIEEVSKPGGKHSSQH
mgnify:FL=1